MWLSWYWTLGVPIAGLFFGACSWAAAYLQHQQISAASAEAAAEGALSATGGGGGTGSSGASLGPGFLPWYGLVMGYHLMSLLFGLPMLYFVLRSSLPLRSLSAWLGDESAEQLQSPQVLQALAAITLPTSLPEAAPATVQTSQIVFQGGSGNQLNLLSSLLGDVVQEGHALPQREEASPPWRDLHGLQRQLAQLLGRTPQTAPSPAAEQMPYGEVHAFLCQLQTATSSLGVGISDMADAYASSADLPPVQEVEEFASALDTAAITLRGLANALRDVQPGSPASAPAPASPPHTSASPGNASHAAASSEAAAIQQPSRLSSPAGATGSAPSAASGQSLLPRTARQDEVRH